MTEPLAKLARYLLDLTLAPRKTRRDLRRLQRKEAVEDLAAKIVQYLIVLAAISAAVSFCVLVFHYIAPDTWLFLTAERIQRLKEVLFSGAVGAVLGVIGKGTLLSNETD